MTQYHRKKAVLYRLYGWTWRQVYLGLAQRDGYTGTFEKVKSFGRSIAYKELRLDALAKVSDWAEKEDDNPEEIIDPVNDYNNFS